MKNPNLDATTPALEELYAMIEEIWDTSHNWTIVPQLATAYPAFADQLYDFFEILVEEQTDAVLNTPRDDADLSRVSPMDILCWYQERGSSIAARAEQTTRAYTTTSPQKSPTDTIAGNFPSEVISLVPSEHAAVRRPLLGHLRAETGRTAVDVAHDLDLDFTLLTLVSRHPRAVPEPWRNDIRRRIAKAYGDSIADSTPIGIPHEQRDGYRIAALRDTSYSEEPVTWETILVRAKISKDKEEFWRRLATQ